MPLVRIKKRMSHRTLDGEVFGGAVVEVSEAEIVAFGDKFEVVEEDEPAPAPVREISATRAAREYAEKHRISLSLSGIQGTGKDGRITLADVKAGVEHGDA